MSWRIVWTEPALRSLQSILWQDAARIDAAVIAYAETGLGDVRRLPTDDAVTVRLRLGDYRVRLTLDANEGVMWVWIVYRFVR
jgi:mRNA-degrading endonuclease RelE of RelBE toxin-antitoxin system